ncbi:toxin-antitoxin system, toxin component, Bro family protein (plasmid) [Brevibacillus laterosporus]|uniref:Toxin-antitoxin system, toxin component, Bro family protein n=1 Tax=Brevibacillus laterosporus TaxID=1465 RepID=A0A518V1Q3_BRELA|nr:toxin-antitoxin system, toxin component, Bro family protein [Brevibacillus laterosporus]
MPLIIFMEVLQMKNLENVFKYNHQEVRIIVIKNEPWFVAKDLCKILEIGNITKTLSRLDDDEFTTSKVIDSIGREQETYVINESGMYSVILTSRKEEARAFKKWVTSEVLPQIRKTGMYDNQISPQPPQLPMSYKEALLALIAEVEQREKLEEQLIIQAPKVEMFETLISAGNSQTMEIVAKSFNIGRNTLFSFLRKHKILMHNNLPYQRYSNYFSVRELPIKRGEKIMNIPQTLVTAKGIEYIGKLLRDNNKIVV